MVRLEVHQAAQGAQSLRLVVDELRVVLECGVVAGSGGVLELGDGQRVEQVPFAIVTPLIVATDAELFVIDRPLGGIGAVLAHLRFSGHDIDADAADARWRPCEVLIHEVLA